MKRTLMSVIVVICLTPVFAISSDDLVRQMEVDIKIQELSKATFEEAKKRAWKAVEKTSLWRKWKASRKAMQPASQECRHALEELSKYRKAYRKTKGLTLRQSYSARYSDSKLQQLREKMGAACTEHLIWSRSEELKELNRKSGAVFVEVRALRKKFTRIIYMQEMEKKLAKLAIEITKGIQKKIERSYKRWEA